MRSVIYTDDMIPITIIDVNEAMQRYLDESRVVTLAVMEPVNYQVQPGNAPVTRITRTVRIFSERLRRNGREHDMLFTYDEESALLLKAAFLPGQVSAVREHERKALARGFMLAVEMFGGAG